MKSIEIEKKVRLDFHQIQKIAQKARLVKEIQINDRYFDASDYRYTTKNMWLRQREGSFELKVGIKKHSGSIDMYEEVTDEKSILKYLGADIDRNLLDTLSQKEISPFCSFTTYRKSYQLDELNIDIDEADFGDLRYRVAEIEIVVWDLKRVQDAEQKITQFIKGMDIDGSIPVPAKLTYYLYCRRPEHYQALVDNKVIQPIIMECIQY